MTDYFSQNVSGISKVDCFVFYKYHIIYFQKSLIQHVTKVKIEHIICIKLTVT